MPRRTPRKVRSEEGSVIPWIACDGQSPCNSGCTRQQHANVIDAEEDELVQGFLA